MRWRVGYVLNAEEDRNRVKNNSSLNPTSCRNTPEKWIAVVLTTITLDERGEMSFMLRCTVASCFFVLYCTFLFSHRSFLVLFLSFSSLRLFAVHSDSICNFTGVSLDPEIPTALSKLLSLSFHRIGRAFENGNTEFDVPVVS